MRGEGFRNAGAGDVSPGIISARNDGRDKIKRKIPNTRDTVERERGKRKKRAKEGLVRRKKRQGKMGTARWGTGR